MSDNLNMNVWLIGAGTMSIEYARVLNSLNVRFKVIGRGEESARKFEANTGIKVIRESTSELLKNHESVKPQYAIVVVGIKELASVTKELIRSGVSHLLVEKPAGLDFNEVMDLAQFANRTKANVTIAYNRRFYASIQKVIELAQDDGGIKSCRFEFSEWANVIEKLNIDPEIKRNWFFANSTHVIDLAFFLIGKPSEIQCYTKGSLSWHPEASIFTGAGITEKEVLFSYHADWNGPGRWGIEVVTRNY